MGADVSLLLLSLFCTPGRAASLDLVEVGGMYGTPAATNPSALWWNPAGLAVGGGTQAMIEVAPTFAAVEANRSNPDYGDVDNTHPGMEAYPDSYDYGGIDNLSFDGVVPFIGLSSNFTLPGLGVGVGLAVPTARGGTSDQEWGPNRFALRDGAITTLHAMGAVSYQILGKVAVGASVSFVDSSYFANTDTTIYPDVAWEAAELLGGTPPTTYQDGYIENQGYSSTLVFGGEEGNGKHGVLKDTAVTFGAGVYVTPIGDKLGISLAYNHGTRLDHQGDLTMRFNCPPDYDALTALGLQQAGLCDPETLEGAVLQGTGKIGYSLPSRIHLGVMVSPMERLRLEVMGAYVFWSAFTDYEITTVIKPDQIDVEDPAVAEETADLVSQERLWARDNVDTFWVGVDGKVKVHDLFTTGARVVFDKSAIPDDAVSANNYDGDTVMLTGLAMLTPIQQLGIGATFGHYFIATRNVTNSLYSVDIARADPNGEDYYVEDPAIDRYFYPSANGTYTGSINRIGIVLKGQIGRNGPNW